MPSAEQLFALVGRIPRGYVTTYGDLWPGAPRRAGAVMASAPQGVAWWRVVRADGSWAKGDEQRRLLEADGVPISGTRVVMRDARLPADALR